MKNLLKLIVLLFALNATAQRTDKSIQALYGATFQNATEVTTATKIPVFDTNLKLNTWISPTVFSSGLQVIDEGNGNGWRFIGEDPSNYGDIGLNALDFGISSSASTIKGATGWFAMNTGRNGTASGVSAVNLARDGIASADSSFNSALRGTADALGSFNSAFYGTAHSFGEVNMGLFSTSYTPISTSSWNGADRLFNIGNGTATSSRSNAFTVLKNGKTGVGYDQFETTSDSELLQVNGEVKANNFVGNINGFSDQIRGTGTTNYISKFTSSGTLGNSQVFDSGTNVGIGTALPSAKLDVNGDAKFDSVLTINDSGTQARLSGSKPILLTASEIELNTVRTELNSQTVAVGPITTPNSEQFGVNGSSYFNGSVQMNSALKDTNGDAGASGQVLSSTVTGTDWVNVSGGVSGSTNYIAKFTSSGTVGNSQIYNNGANVGIGTTSPVSKLHVKTTSGAVSVFEGQNGSTTMAGNIIEMNGSSTNSLRATTAGGYLDFIVNANSVSEPSMTIASSGNVGIGTTTPTFKLQIGEGLYNHNAFKLDGSVSDVLFSGNIFPPTGGVGLWNFINTGTNPTTRFYVQDANNAASRLTFDFKGNNGNTDILAGTSTGNVGVGTTTPDAKLEVTKTSPLGHYFNVSSSDVVSGDVFTIDASENVGIGTATPTEKLEVIGNIEASDGLILTDTQNTNRYKLTIVNGVLTTTLIP